MLRTAMQVDIQSQSIRQPRIRRTGFATAIILVLALAITGCGSGILSARAELPEPPRVAVAQSDPTLTLSPESGHGGIYVQVSGSGWPSNMMVIVALSDVNGRSSTLAASNTDRTGNLNTGFLYPIDTRWLTSGAHDVVAESADGKVLASASFSVPTRGDQDAPAQVITATEEAIEEATVAVTEAATAVASAEATATATLPPTVIPTPQAQAAADDGNQGKDAPPERAAGQSNRPPIALAQFVPVRGDDDNARWRVLATATDPDGNLRSVTALLLVPSLEFGQKLELEVKEKTEIKLTADKIEIKGPDPQALFDQIRAHGGMVVPDGQLIEFKFKDAFQFKLEQKEGILHIEAPGIALQVIAVDTDGATHSIIASPQAPHIEKEKGKDKDKEKEKKKGKGKNKDKGSKSDDGDEDD